MNKRSSKKNFSRLLVIGLLLIIFLLLPLWRVYISLRSLRTQSRELSQAFKNQNLDQVQSSIRKMKSSADSLHLWINLLSWLEIVPLVGGYHADARKFSFALTQELAASQILVKDLDPYKAELGFNNVPTPGQDKIAQFVKILDKLLPNLDQVKGQLQSASSEVSDINTNKYPENFGKFKLKTDVETAKNFILGVALAVTKARGALEVAPSALGEPNSKTYLILFQNDKELRATGGFMTAYAFLKLDHGHVSSTTSDDIYRLDEKLLNVCLSKICPLTPPEPIVKYLPEANGKPRTAWSMRDSNLSPDLPTSMKQFEGMYFLLGEGAPFDGIITIDTEVVKDMISITGPVDVFGVAYSGDIDKRCNCPNVIYELENYSEIVAKGQQGRKAILGTLMQQILAKALAASTEKIPEFVSTGANLANSKHLMFYMHDQKTQDALSGLNWTGRIRETSGDYLHINDSNFAGGKTNLYVNEDITLDIDPNSGKHKLSISYSNPQPYNSWLNNINRDYVRIYVPQGSKLNSSRGSDVEVATTPSELGKTVYEAFIQIRPQNSRSLTFEYTTLRGDYGSPYPILIQKQPGTKNFKYAIKINGFTKASFNLSEDKNLKL